MSHCGRGRKTARVLRVALPLFLAALAGGLAYLTEDLKVRAMYVGSYPTAWERPASSASGAIAPGPRERSAASKDLGVEKSLRPGETLGGVLRGLGLDGTEAHQAAVAVARHADLRQLKPGDLYAAYFDDAHALSSFELALAGKGRVVLARSSGTAGTAPSSGLWNGSWHPFEKTVARRAIRGQLDGMLESAVTAGGGRPELTYAMAEVLQWDLDFNRDLQRGDQFEVLYEEVFVEGEYFGLGDVLAVSYTNRGRRLEAYRFGDGYYDAEGRPLEKMFLRSPLAFSRVTSRFSPRRFHPVLKSYRPHYGVDYGAPVGTPARVTAAGVVTFVGWDGGGGKTVKVRHPNDYLSCYLHLSRFAKGLKAGSRVRQGEVVGYVGSTGLATGPHLDYRVQHRGRWIDPLALKSVPAEPIPQVQLARFRGERDAMRDHLAAGVTPPAEPVTAAVLLAARPTTSTSGVARR